MKGKEVRCPLLETAKMLQNPVLADQCEHPVVSMLPNISTSSSPENAIRGSQSPLQGNAGKFRDIQGLLLKNRVMPRKGQSRFLGRGCDEALFSGKKGFSVKRGEAIQ